MCPVDHDVSYVQSSRILHLTILKYGVSLYIFTTSIEDDLIHYYYYHHLYICTCLVGTTRENTNPSLCGLFFKKTNVTN